MNEKMQALKECAAIAEYHKLTSTAAAARETITALEALIEAALEYIYQTPWDGKNKEHEAIMSAVHNLGYSYCEGCDRWTTTTSERKHLKHYPALCDQCTTEAEMTERATNLQQEFIDELQTIAKEKAEQARPSRYHLNE